MSPDWELPAGSPASYPVRSGDDWATWLRDTWSGPVNRMSGPAWRQDLAATWAALVHLARREGFAVDRARSAESTASTAWATRHIHVHADLTAEQAVTALAHELGHVLLRRETARLDPADTVPCQGIRKVEADSVAYLTGLTLGIDTGDLMFPYVASWAGADPRARPDATIQTVAERVVAAASRITGHLENELGPYGSRKTEQALDQSVAAYSGKQRPPATTDDLVRINEVTNGFFRDRMTGSWVPGYLAERGFSRAVQESWQAGYAPAAWDALTRRLRSLGYSDTLMEASGLARRSRHGTLIDTFRDRAMIPIHSPNGTVAGFIGRAPEHARPGTPKYLNSPHTSLFDKRAMLFGLWENRNALAAGAQPVLVEGPFDAIAVSIVRPARYAGITPCGTALTDEQVTALRHATDLRKAGALVAFDADRAGQRAAVRAYHLLNRFTVNAAAARFPPGQDPAQVLKEHGPGVLADVLSRTSPLTDLVVDAELDKWNQWLEHAEGQINAMRAVAPLVAAMPPGQVGRQVGRLADRLGLPHGIVTKAVTDAVPQVVDRQPVAIDRDPANPSTDLSQSDLACRNRTANPLEPSSRPCARRSRPSRTLG